MGKTSDRERYELRRSEGGCWRCGQPAALGRSMCPEHLEEAKAKAAAKRRRQTDAERAALRKYHRLYKRRQRMRIRELQMLA